MSGPLLTLEPTTAERHRRTPRVVLLGNPNAGKTTLFNALTGHRAKTANFPGTTVSHRVGAMERNGFRASLVDLPGLYSLNPTTLEERIAAEAFLGGSPHSHRPEAAIVVADATNLERNLFLVSQVLEHDVPVVVALNMIDLADAEGMRIDVAGLSRELGCPVVAVSAKTGRGLDDLVAALAKELGRTETRIPIIQQAIACSACSTCPFQNRYTWTESVAGRFVRAPRTARSGRTEQIDRVLTHPVGGLIAFFGVMAVMFYLIFHLASVPMDMIDHLFATIGNLVARVVPPGDLQSLLVNGVIGGVGGILVFLPQICILFFFLALLEDTGYLARAAFVMDRLMRRIGLPGKAFVPLLSAHACAIPAIMATRVIEDRRDRLVTILVAPLMTCSARIPVYTMVIALLFPDKPGLAAATFLGAYGVGIIAGILSAFLLKRTILPGETRPLVIELPNYRMPSLRTALLHTYDQARMFVKQAGTLILMISVILWAMATYPKSDPPAEALQLREQAAALNAAGQMDKAAELEREATFQEEQYALAHSLAGRIGHWIEPLIEPLGFNWQIGIGIVSSFAAREVIVSTLAVVYGVGADRAEEEPTSLYDTLRQARRADGSPVFTTATCFSLLVFYILAAQCLPTQAVTRKETGSWKWAALQLGYMSVLAYTAAWATYQALRALGIS
ncbi:MAG: ferrous iron transport protein B [Kiritimatiellae bacterium]|nr:ferrous iron transport protein B [Kiritimatiellia bacterium]MDW8458897.1 ferrous iron transport protein B [Verrucomicrobiota bacterium]